MALIQQEFNSVDSDPPTREIGGVRSSLGDRIRNRATLAAWIVVSLFVVTGASFAQGGNKPNKPKPGKPVVPDPPPEKPNDGKAPKPDAPDKPTKPGEPDRPPGQSRHAEREEARAFGRRPGTPAIPLVDDPRLKWGVRLSGVARAAAIHDGANLYVCTASGTLSAHALGDGVEVWSVSLGSGATARPTFAGDRLVIPLRNGQIVAIDKTTGSVKNTTRNSGPVDVALAAAAGGTRIVSSTAQGDLVVLDAQTFGLVTRFGGIPGLSLGVPTIDAETTLVSDSSGLVRSIDLKTGRAKWEQQLYSAVATPLLLVPGAPTQVIVGTAGGDLFALDATTGKERWKTKGYSAYVGAALRGKELVVAFANRRLMRLDAATGKLIEERTLRDPPVSPPIVAGSTLLVPCASGRIETFDASFRALDALLLGSEILEIDSSKAPLVFTTEDGDVYRFEET